MGVTGSRHHRDAMLGSNGYTRRDANSGHAAMGARKPRVRDPNRLYRRSVREPPRVVHRRAAIGRRVEVTSCHAPRCADDGWTVHQASVKYPFERGLALPLVVSRTRESEVEDESES